MIGDGSLTGGMAFEGLNNLGHSGSRAVIILNDNGRSYAPTVSKLGESLGRLRLNPSYVRNRARLDRLLHEVPLVGEHLERGVDGALAALREMFEPPAFFETLGVRYTGPFDGHDIEGSSGRSATRPSTTGRSSSTSSPRRAGATRRPRATRSSGCTTCPTPSRAATPRRSPRRSSRRPSTGPSSWPSRRRCPTRPGLLPFEERFPDRFFDVGIAEQHAVTAAAGMAMGGLRPVVAIYSTFLTAGVRPGQPRRRPARPARRVLPRPGGHHRRRRRQPPRRARHGAADEGAGHDDLRPVVVPGAGRHAPRRPGAVTDGPAAIRWPKTAARGRRRPTRSGRGLSARKVRPGGDVCLLGVGKMLAAARVGGRRAGRRGRGRDRVGRAGAEAPRRGDAGRRGRPPGGGHRSRTATARAASARPSPAGSPSGPGRRAARRRGGAVLGIPMRYIPHGKPDAILAGFGLDAAGVAHSARDLLA